MAAAPARPSTRLHSICVLIVCVCVCVIFKYQTQARSNFMINCMIKHKDNGTNKEF